MLEIKYAKVTVDAKAPTRKNITDAGMDVYSLYDRDIAPLEWSIIDTGISFNIPEGYCIIVKPKSRSNYLIGAGVIDSGYQGSVLVKIFNASNNILSIQKGDAIAQLLIIPVETPYLFEESSEFLHKVKTARNSTGGIVTQLSSIEVE